MRHTFYLFLFSLLLVGCQTKSHNLTHYIPGLWKYADVRLLDPVDRCDPEQDLIVLYTRAVNQDFQIRIDFLDINSTTAQDIYIPIDTQPGGSSQIKTKHGVSLDVELEWDLLIVIPASGNIQLVNSNYTPIIDYEIYIFINSIQDNIVLSIDKNSRFEIPPLAILQVLVTKPGQAVIVDQLIPVSIDAPPPPRAKVLFMIWNSFSSSTPAEALRSWSGAHSGPVSGRHGMKYLLEFADRTNYPVFSFDMLPAHTLSAFDYIGVNNWISDLQNKEKFYLISRNNYEKERFLFLEKNKINSIGYNGYAQLYNNNQLCLSIVENVFTNSPITKSLFDCKSLLITNGYANSPHPVIFGGDFQRSLLGDPGVLEFVRAYIYNHPWIQVLLLNDLQANNYDFERYSMSSSVNRPGMEANSLDDSTADLHKRVDAILLELTQIPDNQFSDLAWHIFSSLTNPDLNELRILSSAYINQLGYIIAAAKWLDKPEASSSCDIDLDYDGDSECLLSNNTLFITIEPQGAYIPFAFSRDNIGAHQIIGPSWQFMLGISDPSELDISQGLQSDPGQILGAFANNLNQWANYEFVLTNNKVTLYNEMMLLRKSFILTNNQLLIEITDESDRKYVSQIPLVLDPWIMYSKNWGDKYIYEIISNDIHWKIDSGISIQLSSNQPIVFTPFTQSRDAIAKPEDPNFDYGRGHYLPFPMALAEIQSTGFTEIKLFINP
jgi:hypothetical protein